MQTIRETKIKLQKLTQLNITVKTQKYEHKHNLCYLMYSYVNPH